VDPDAGWTDPVEGGDPPEHEAAPSGMEWAEDEGPFYAWLPPEDRLWRHPSEGHRGESSDLRVGGGNSRRWVTSRPRVAVRSTWAVAVVAGLIGATTATGVGLVTGLWPHDTTVIKSQLSSTSAVSLAAAGSQSTNWQAIDDSVAASVVTVSVEGGAGPEIGSGMVWLQPAQGAAYVITDRSLFARGLAAGYIGQTTVTFLSGASAAGRLVGADALSGLAVVRIEGEAASSAVPAAIGTMANLGDAGQILAVGSRAAASISTGSVSAEDRSVELTDGTDLDGLLAVTMPSLSTTAAGGPVLDQYGRVVGITLNLTPADSSDEPLTFAVPIDSVSRLATQIIDGARLTHPWLGITDAGDLPSVTARQLRLSGGVQAGAVSRSSPAGRAGMQSNDIIVSLNGQPVTATVQLMAQMSDCVPGDRVALTYVHSGRTVATVVQMGEEPEDS
jgi:S1-C subfamily serine protease